MITMANASYPQGKALTIIQFVNEKFQILEEEDLETSKTWELFVSITNDFQTYYDSLQPSILVKALEEPIHFENQGDIKSLECQYLFEKKIKSESSKGWNPANDKDFLLRIKYDVQKKEIVSIQALKNGKLIEFNSSDFEQPLETSFHNETSPQLCISIVLGGDIAEIEEKTWNLNTISNQNALQKVQNVNIQSTRISKNDESLFTELLKRNLVTIDRIRDKLTFYTYAQ